LTVYIDIIFLENLFMNYIILFATSIITKIKTRHLRLLSSSFIGSIYAVMLYMNILKIITTNVILKCLLSIIMIYIAFNPKKIKIFLKELIIFYLTSFTFGGVTFSLIYFLNSENILIHNGILIGRNQIKIILLGGIIGFLIITYSFKNIKGKISKKNMLCNMKISINKKYTNIKAIIDTGNFLKEPISKTPVIIVEKEILQKIIPNYILNNLNNIITGEIIELGDYVSKIKFIPYNSLGKQNGMLIGIKADEVLVDYEEKNILVKDIIIGIYDGNLCKNKKYRRVNRGGYFRRQRRNCSK